MTESPTLVVAFLGGVLLFISPCVAPLIPAYLASIAGVDPGQARRGVEDELRVSIVKNSILFIAGFSLIFIVLGVFIGALTSTVAGFQTWLNRIGGALIVLMALHMLGLIKLPILERRSTMDSSASGASGTWRAALMGISFGISWTPCTGPVLAAILALSATTASPWLSAQLMTAFSLGLALPFFLTALATRRAARWFTKAPHLLLWISRVGGVLLLTLGVIIFTGRLQAVIGQFYRWLA